VIRLDFVPDKEFHPLFMRVSSEVDLRGAFTPEEVNKRLITAAATLRSLAHEGYLSKRNAYRRSDNLEKLVDTKGTDFGTRAIATARRHPHGVENLTLNYGHVEAIDRLLERNRRLRRMTRMRRR
jgi:hypothetical protein